jgi:hypothetical protein
MLTPYLLDDLPEAVRLGEFGAPSYITVVAPLASGP